nr:metallophosphoesterase family protein [Lysinibacillus timonensis]
MNRILAISDIHGHLEALKTLLHFAEYEPNKDELYFVGDYIDKGPNSVGTLRAVKQYVENGAFAIMGNHEKRAIKEDIKSGISIWGELSDFLESLPLYIERPPYIFVHAGIRTGIPLHKQKEEDLLTIREPFFNNRIEEEAIVVFGHTPTHRLDVPIGILWSSVKKLGIDTGAGLNHYLSLVDLTNRIHYRVPVLHPFKQSVKVFRF